MRINGFNVPEWGHYLKHFLFASFRFWPKGFNLQACGNVCRRYTGLAFLALKRPFDVLFTILWFWPDTHPKP